MARTGLKELRRATDSSVVNVERRESLRRLSIPSFFGGAWPRDNPLQGPSKRFDNPEFAVFRSVAHAFYVSWSVTLLAGCTLLRDSQCHIMSRVKLGWFPSP